MDISQFPIWIKNLIKTREIKCPKCNAKLGQDNIRSIFLEPGEGFIFLLIMVFECECDTENQDDEIADEKKGKKSFVKLEIELPNLLSFAYNIIDDFYKENKKDDKSLNMLDFFTDSSKKEKFSDLDVSDLNLKFEEESQEKEENQDEYNSTFEDEDSDEDFDEDSDEDQDKIGGNLNLFSQMGGQLNDEDLLTSILLDGDQILLNISEFVKKIQKEKKKDKKTHKEIQEMVKEVKYIINELDACLFFLEKHENENFQQDKDNGLTAEEKDLLDSAKNSEDFLALIGVTPEMMKKIKDEYY